MKRQWDALMEQAARLAAGFDQACPEIRPEFVVAGMFYVRRGVCGRMYECLTVEEPDIQALYLECLARHYAVSLPDALRCQESGDVPEVKLSPLMRRMVRNARREWRKNHDTDAPVDYLLEEIFTYYDGLPVLDLCLMEADADREMLYSYLMECSRHFGGTHGSWSKSVKTYTSLQDLDVAMESGSTKKTLRTEVKRQKDSQLDKVEAMVRRNLIGQDRAVEAVMRALKKYAAGLKEENKPIGVFLFAGPTGVGKTELARVLAAATKMAFRRFDMSEYGEKHEAARLYGSPPGYVGYEEGGQLTNFVSRNPKSIVVFDEVDKAHPDVLNALLQIAEEGTLTDGVGRMVKFADTLIIITTNAGAQDATKRMVGFGSGASVRNYREAAYRRAINEFFRPELRGRMSEIVIFNDLEPEQILTIAHLELAKLCERIKKNREVNLVIEPNVAMQIAEQSNAELYGARGLKITIDKRISEPLADFILEHNALAGTTVRIMWVDQDAISMKIDPPLESKKAFQTKIGSTNRPA